LLTAWQGGPQAQLVAHTISDIGTRYWPTVATICPQFACAA